MGSSCSTNTPYNCSASEIIHPKGHACALESIRSPSVYGGNHSSRAYTCKSLSWLNSADKNRIVQQLKTEMINVLGVNPATAVEDESEEAEPPAKKPACSEEEDFNLLFGQKEDEGLEPVEADDLLKVIQDELERYLKTAETNFRSDDPLLWWRNHESCFPTIAKLTRKYLSIPAFTAPAERVFSTAKNTVQKKRWRILSERLCRCIFLRQNKNLF